MMLYSMPAQLLFRIAKHLPTCDLNSLLRTNRYFQKLLDPILLKRASAIPDKTKALCVAAKNGHTKLAAVLLRKGANSDPHTFWAEKPLLAAIINGHESTVRILLPWVDCHQWFRYTIDVCTEPLHIAAIIGNGPIVKLLLAEGIRFDGGYSDEPEDDHEEYYCDDVSGHVDSDVQPLLLASSLGHLEVVKLLLNAGADVNYCAKYSFQQKTALVEMVTSRFWEDDFSYEGWEDGAPMSRMVGYSALDAAKRAGKDEVVKFLLARGADPNLPPPEDDRY